MSKKQAKTPETPEEETAEDGAVVGTGNDARLKMMQEINDRNDQELSTNGDLFDVNDDGSTTKFEASAEETEEKTDEEIVAEEVQRAEQEANATDESEEETEGEPAAKHKIKVNGKELELTTQELIERAQKVESADEYLKEAAKKVRETIPAPKEIPAAQQPSEQDVTAKALEEKRRIVRAIQMGSEEEAMAALEQLQGKTPSLKEDDISRVVEQRIAFDKAFTKFQETFPEIVNDPVLWSIASQMDKEITATGDRRDYWERYQEIGNNIRTWRDGIVKTATPPKQETSAPVSAEKQQRKASVPAVPKGASTKAPAAVEEEDKEESTSEVIAAMAKARGGPQWLRS